MENENEKIESAIQEAEKDISMADDINARHQAELDAKDAKYAALLKAYQRGERATSTEVPPEKTAEDERAEYESNIKAVADNQINGLEQAKRILAIREYRLSHDMTDIFAPDEGTPSEEDLSSYEKTAALLQDAIDNSRGDLSLFSANIKSSLKDNKYIK